MTRDRWASQQGTLSVLAGQLGELTHTNPSGASNEPTSPQQ